MISIPANRHIVRAILQTQRIEISIMSQREEMIRSLTEDETLEFLADIVNAIAENKRARDAED